ncbi:hypothetical protein K443DRAFT_675991 [Laccaria amethystina LaAM-08-1]|uniref:Uncharacterized protein n=1 Tax=Laccaria amethystina LaAM-08-1 TaxID=1095629 RepID=A0A0C9XHF2_9AGAR|nr:hypothetical protein K443DRAFT_675991 [Laccaria amethystina LaAM-08-1]
MTQINERVTRDTSNFQGKAEFETKGDDAGRDGGEEARAERGGGGCRGADKAVGEADEIAEPANVVHHWAISESVY